MTWYTLHDPGTIDTPALLLYPDRIRSNIAQAVALAGGAARLRPHVKTHKLAEVARMHREAGIDAFKCATLAEAEMLARIGAPDVLLAHQPVGPKAQRLCALARAYPDTRFAAIVDDAAAATHLAACCRAAGTDPLDVLLDLDVGMGRTGIAPGPDAQALYRLLFELPGLRAAGLHAYDGHLRQSDRTARQQAADHTYGLAAAFRDTLLATGLPVPILVIGGTPTFPCHAQRPDVCLSPGTFPLWDAGYSSLFPDLPFVPAAVLATRIVSKPGGDRICLDLGHKAVAAENPIDRRVHFPDVEVVEWLGQSEEHLVLRVADPARHQVGDLWYGLPWHICPTTALYGTVQVVGAGVVEDEWRVVARDRRLTDGI
ncbi:MAG: D-TA family PLP-dependent enzyme [Bacteroidia bacterium]